MTKILKTIYLGLGSNIGDKQANCSEAIQRIESINGIKLLRKSSFYITKPVGGPKQDDYLNGVLEIQINDEDINFQLLEKFKEIERCMGRSDGERNSPRIIDIDILLADDLVINEEDMQIPHPRMHERYFVLKGLKELAPGAVHPIFKKTIQELYADTKNCQ
ncbi:MAG: 2-amino-4-hydroxy-6-hydroxymethyldihydropteridine diphosphokinase [Candidatus Omnitrophica bacterium]|nr:2-amino-4-hydroxy-6-hydroxymethyldihydropteridine diphosphokinase [Candidatus Omnitrophota bacterium]